MRPRRRPRPQSRETGKEAGQPDAGETLTRHVDGVLDMAAKAYRLGKVDLAKRLLARLDNERLTEEQATRWERALKILKRTQGEI